MSGGCAAAARQLLRCLHDSLAASICVDFVLCFLRAARAGPTHADGGAAPPARCVQKKWDRSRSRRACGESTRTMRSRRGRLNSGGISLTSRGLPSACFSCALRRTGGMSASLEARVDSSASAHRRSTIARAPLNHPCARKLEKLGRIDRGCRVPHRQTLPPPGESAKTVERMCLDGISTAPTNARQSFDKSLWASFSRSVGPSTRGQTRPRLGVKQFFRSVLGLCRTGLRPLRNFVPFC